MQPVRVSVVFLTGLLGFCSSALGAINASDEANNYATSGQPAWANGTNQGSFFQPWSGLSTNGGGFGFFTGTSTNNDASGTGTNINSANGLSFGLYANSGNTSQAIRPFTGALTIGQSVVIRMDNGSIDPGNAVGFGLQDASGVNAFEFFFQGGNSNYTVSGSINQSTAHGFTRFGMETTFTLTGASTYAFSVRFLNDNATETFTGSLIGAAGAIDRFRLFNFSAGNGNDFNAYFNGFAVVPEPATWLTGALVLGAAGWFVRRKR